MEEYVRESHPTPEEFIKHLLPKTDFEKPYTAKEKQIIDSNEDNVEKYVAWIKDKIKSKKLIGGDSWESLGAVRMIWQDEVHTPDFEHLDLLFGDELRSKPVKLNGRLYEYDAHDPAHFSGLASGFFSSVPARLIEMMCFNCSQEITKKFGYDFDLKRFDYSYQADKADELNVWRKESRPKAYKMLLRNIPSFCKGTWSDYTEIITHMETYKRTEHPAISKEEEQRRKAEARQVCEKLSPEECKRYAVDTIKRTPTVWTVIGIIVLCTIAMVVILALVAGSVSDEVGEILEGVLFGVIGAGFIVIVMVIFFSSVPNKKHGGVNRKVYDYITVLQDAFYNQTNEYCAKKYQEFLERIRETEPKE